LFVADAILIPRVIPCLLLDDDGLVKTVRFEAPNYLGDPINVVNLFNQFEVDEILLLDIRATVDGRQPGLDLIEELAAECWVPLTYGGGISDLETSRKILSRGVEKIVLGTAAAENPSLIRAASDEFGAQAVVVSVDARRRRDGGYGTFVRSGSADVGLDPAFAAARAVEMGAGEILINSIDEDGMMAGYDLELIKSVSLSVSVPVIACGGAGSRSHLAEAIKVGGASAVAAGSIFVYRGPDRGVLINFPDRAQLEGLLA
jgi:cyclase